MTTATPTLEVSLVVQGRTTRTWSSDDGVVTVGSGEGMTIRGGRAVLNRHHATLHVEGGQVLAVAEDEAEIEHNGEPVTFAVVRPDDELRIGPLTLQARIRLAEPPRSRTLTPSRARRTAQPAPRAVASLGIRLPDGRSRSIPIHEGRFVVGSGQVNLRLPGLVERHAELVVTGERLLLAALDGPVRVGDRSVPKLLLRPGVVARLGDVELCLEGPRRQDVPAEPAPSDIDERTASPAVAAEKTATEALVADTTASTTIAARPAEDTTAAIQGSSERTARLPSSFTKHPDDEDYDDELDFIAPFDLAASLRRLPAEARPSRGGRCVPSVLLLEGGRVRDLGLLEVDQTHELPDGGPRCAAEPQRVVVTWPDGSRHVALLRGQSVLVVDGARTWRISAVVPPPPPIIPNIPGVLGYVLLLGVSTFLSLSAHGMLGIGINALAAKIGEPLEIEPVQEEEFAEVEMRLEEPDVVERREVLQLAEKAPAVTTQEVTRASELPRSENTSVNSLLSKLSATEAGPAGLKDAITNIDAVAAGSGASTAFNLAGRLAAGSGVKVARSGTGAVNTAGQVGDGVGQLAAGARGGVRGKVTKLSSRMKVKGTLDPGEVTRVVNAHLSAIQSCYEREMTKNPGLAGRILFEWTIRTNGTVRAVRVQSSTMPSDIVANCISAEIKTWSFARPTGGEAVISYPFAFRSG